MSEAVERQLAGAERLTALEQVHRAAVSGDAYPAVARGALAVVIAERDALLVLLEEAKKVLGPAADVRRISDDMADFDGDRRGHWEAFEQAVEQLGQAARQMSPDLLLRILSRLNEDKP
jgi:hypothetical protein